MVARTGWILTLLLGSALVGEPAQAPPDSALVEAAERIEAGDAEAAAASLAAFLSARSGDPAAHHQAGALWLLGGEPGRAAPHLEAALALDPEFVDSRLALGQALGQLGEVEAALTEFAVAAQSAPARYEAPYLAAAVLDGAGRPSEAVDRARKAAELAPRHPGVRRFLGRLLLRVELWPEAQAALEAALRLGYREDPAIFADLGAALVAQERLQAARAAYERHRSFAPDDPETLLQLGYLDWRAGDYQASEERLGRAIALDPGLRRAHHFLGLTALRRLDLGRAEAAFRRALEEGEDFPEAWFHLGKIALRRGDNAEAARLLETAIRYSPEYADAYYQLGFARRRLGDPEGAAAALARFEELRRNPESKPGERR